MLSTRSTRASARMRETNSSRATRRSGAVIASGAVTAIRIGAISPSPNAVRS